MREHTPKSGVEMTAAATALRDECALRFREAVLQAIPSMARKRVARILGTSPETVDGWIDHEAPQLPSTKHLLASFAVFGPGFTAHVLFPCGAWVRALSMEARMEQLRMEIDDLRREIDAIVQVSSPDSLVDKIKASLDASQKALEKAKEAN